MGQPGPQGVAGPVGPTGPQTPQAAPRTGPALRVIKGAGPSANCNGGEVMISAFCHGAPARALTTTENGAKCAADFKSVVDITIVCAKL
jgi:hypothetical protein